MNIRYEIDQTLVKAVIDKRLVELEQLRIRFKKEAQDTLESYERSSDKARSRWPRKPEGAGYVDPMIDEWIDRELNHYSKVRIIELSQEGKRFVLVYGDADDSTVSHGTGPFKSYEEAAKWFLNSGR
jgi:hypothetical protein